MMVTGRRYKHPMHNIKQNRWLQSKETGKAEILWALTCVQSHFSMKSNDDAPQIFQAMFWDSHIAKNYNCGRTRQSYLITFEIAPFFKLLLVDDIKKSDFYLVIFDEFFSGLLQKEQMDVLIWYWKADRIVTRYLGSQFLSSGSAEDLLKALKAALMNFDPTHMVQFSTLTPNCKKGWLKIERGQIQICLAWLTLVLAVSKSYMEQFRQVLFCNLH